MNVPVTVWRGPQERFLNRRQLERWLLRSGVPTLSQRDRSRRFVMATLRDLFASDSDVDAWLAMPRPELEGASARTLLATSRAREVESLVVREWNRR